MNLKPRQEIKMRAVYAKTSEGADQPTKDAGQEVLKMLKDHAPSEDIVRSHAYTICVRWWNR